MTAMIIRRRKLGLGSCRGLKAASTTGIDYVRNDQYHTKDWSDVTHIIRWGTTSNLPIINGLPAGSATSGIVIINPADAIHLVNDKATFRKLVQYHHPDIVPKTWFDLDDFGIDSEDDWEESEFFPIIVRRSKHAQGKYLHFCESWDETREACSNYSDYYISEYIQKEAEYRVYMVSGRVAGVARKMVEDTSAVAWNRARTGCEFVNQRWSEWPLEVCRVACEAFKLSGLDFGGVDVMVSTEGRPYVIEINSACSLPLLEDGSVSYRQKCMAKCFDYIIQNGKDYIDHETDNGYRGYIHPALIGE